MRYLFVALLLLKSISTYAQDTCKGFIYAEIIEKHNLEPIYPASVYIDELQKDYEVHEGGKLVIRNVCAGTYTVHVHAFGYEHFAEVITVNGRSHFTFRLAHVEHALSEVNITEKRAATTLLQNKEQLDKDKIISNSGHTFSEMLQTINGVTLLSNGGTISKPVIHGLHSNRIVILNNGIRQEDQQWGAEHAPDIDPFLASNITVVKGAAGVRYGTDAIAGVVLMEPATLRNKPGWDGEVNLAGFSNNRMGVASGMLEHNFSKLPALTLRLQGTLKKGGNYRTANYWVDNTGIREQNYSITAGWKKRHYSIETFYSHFNTTLGIYRGSHTGNQNDLMAAIDSKVPLFPADFTYGIRRPKQHVTHDLVKTKFLMEKSYGVWSLTHAYQHNFRQEYDVIRIDRDEAQLNLTLNTQSLNLNFDQKQMGNFSGQMGIDGFYQENFSRPGDRLFIPNFTSFNGALYAIERYSGKNWILEGGLRYDKRAYDVYNPEGSDQHIVHYIYNFGSTSGTLGFQHQLNEKWSWRTTLATAWRAPQPSELFSAGLHNSAARLEIGNKNLQAERSYSINLEAKHSIANHIAFEGLTYMQYVNNFIYLSPGLPVQTIRGYFKSFNYQQTNVLLNGLDVSVTYWFTKHLTSTFKASFVRAENLVARDWLIQMPSDRFSLGLRYKTDISNRFKQVYAGISGRMVLQQERIPGNFSQIDYPAPPPTYQLIDAEAGLAIMYRAQPINLSITIQNLTNTAYRDYMDVFRYFIDQPGRNVALRLRVPFEFN